MAEPVAVNHFEDEGEAPEILTKTPGWREA